TIGLEEACVAGLKCIVKLDDILGMSCDARKGRFRVIWVGQAGTPQAGRIAVRALDTSQNIWGLDLSQLSAPVPVETGERRYPCKGAISIWQAETQYPINAAVSDISLRGCYVELMNPLPAGTEVSMLLNVPGLSIRATGQVRTSHPAVGMGIQFEEMIDTDRALLQDLVAKLATVEEEASR
ncbi:MAG TPA: PilZ domain-containing protein, partial [Clostridia bacterium]|nr:PilZ domain-containing protein [Clostridia bacterium]